MTTVLLPVYLAVEIQVAHIVHEHGGIGNSSRYGNNGRELTVQKSSSKVNT
jgi:hypothetical protein